MSTSAEFDKAWVVSVCNAWLANRKQQQDRTREEFIAKEQKRWLPWLKPRTREQAIARLKRRYTDIWDSYYIAIHWPGCHEAARLKDLLTLCSHSQGSTVRLSPEDARCVQQARLILQQKEPA